MVTAAAPCTARDPSGVAAAALDFSCVYAEHFDYVYRLVARLAGREDADDLVQEVFLVVHRRLSEFEGRALITTWLFRIAYRVVGAHVRRERLRRWLARALVGSDDRSSAPSGLLSVEEAERRQATLETLARLSWKKRAVLILHEVEEWSCPEIAARIGVPVGTVYTRLHHARREMARHLRRRGIER